MVNYQLQSRTCHKLKRHVSGRLNEIEIKGEKTTFEEISVFIEMLRNEKFT
jgi:hypothetical protein